MSRFIRYAKTTGYMTERYLWICGFEVVASRSPHRYYSVFNIVSCGTPTLRSLYFTASRSRLHVRWTTIRGRLHRRELKRRRQARIDAYMASQDAA